MIPIYGYHTPSGTSTKQLMQYGQSVRYGNFGKYIENDSITDDSKITPDFELWRITAPIQVLHSSTDRFATPKDVNLLLDKLNNSLKSVHFINEPEFNHADFLWGIDAAELVYSKVLDFFELY